MPPHARNDETFDDVVRLLVDVLGPEFLLDIEITRDTTFNSDLGLESIEFVVLLDKLNERYGPLIDVTAFLAAMDLDEIMAMSVGRLVAYIEQRIQVASDAAA